MLSDHIMFFTLSEPDVSYPRTDVQASHGTLDNPTYIQDSTQSIKEAYLNSKYHINVNHWFQVCPVQSSKKLNLQCIPFIELYVMLEVASILDLYGRNLVRHPPLFPCAPHMENFTCTIPPRTPLHIQRLQTSTDECFGLLSVLNVFESSLHRSTHRQ